MMNCDYGGFKYWDSQTDTFRAPMGTDPSGVSFVSTTSTCSFTEVTALLNGLDKMWSWNVFSFAVGLSILVVLLLWTRR